MLRKISLGSFGITVGGVLAVIGFIAYAQHNPTLNLVGFFYGVPLLLGGLALKAAELKPVPVTQVPSPQILKLRQQQATPTQNQIRQDVTRYRYGQEAHLDTSLKHLGLSPSDQERPMLVGLHETAINHAYALVLEFESPLISLETWQQKQQKIAAFFGPGIEAVVTSISEPESGDRFDLSLIATQAKVDLGI
jgi:Protein of unknown function (DUF2854)